MEIWLQDRVPDAKAVPDGCTFIRGDKNLTATGKQQLGALEKISDVEHLSEIDKVSVAFPQ